MRHNERVSRMVFIALEGLSLEQFGAWKPPIAQLRDIPNSHGVIVSCAGAAVLHAHHAAWHCHIHQHAGLTRGLSAAHHAAAGVPSSHGISVSCIGLTGRFGCMQCTQVHPSLGTTGAELLHGNAVLM